MNANIIGTGQPQTQSQRIVSPPNQARGGTRSALPPTPTMANHTSEAAPMPPTPHPHQQHHAPPPPASLAANAWGQTYHHHHPPPMRYTHVPPPPPRSYRGGHHSRSHPGRGPMPGNFIFQAGPPPPHHQQHQHQQPPILRAPPQHMYYHQPQHPQQQPQQQRPAYSYPPAPAQQRPIINNSMMNHTQSLPTMKQPTQATATTTAITPAAHVTPSTAPKRNLARSRLISRDGCSSPLSSAKNSSNGAAAYDASKAAAIGTTRHTTTTTAASNIETTAKSAIEMAAVIASNGMDKRGGNNTNNVMMESSRGGEEKQDKLAAVDAIFAAAEVIAKRPSPPPPLSHQKHHDVAPTSITTTGINKKQVVQTPTPKKPIKKRKVSTTTPIKKITPPSKKKCRKSKKKSSNNSSTSTTSPDQYQQQPTTQSSSPENDDQHLSSRALFLSQTIEAEPGLYRALLLHMALERETPRKPGGGAPDHHCKMSLSSSSSSNGGGGVLSTSSNNNSSNNNSSDYSSPCSGQGVSIGKKRGNQYVEGVRTPDSGENKVITDGFFWKDVPQLESILQRYMEEYYEMSENCPQSKKQQEFNNRLVNIVHQTALQCGYTFDPLSFGGSNSRVAQSHASSSSSSSSIKPANARKKLPTKANKNCINSTTATTTMDTSDNFNYKKLRDRIRCYYKTHVQNSKKRLITLLKNPTRPKNREVLIKIVNDVKVRANSGNGVGRKLSPDGTAALKRLEARERSMMMYSHGCLVSSLDLATTPESGQQQQQGAVLPSVSISSSQPSISGGSSGWNQTSEWHAPPSPRRVSMGPDHYQRTGGNSLNAEVPPFASPCKPEHVAILQSIRQVSVQL